MKQESIGLLILQRVYAALLYAYPKAFRMRFGAEMRQIFRDRWRAASATPYLLTFVANHRSRLETVKRRYGKQAYDPGNGRPLPACPTRSTS